MESCTRGGSSRLSLDLALEVASRLPRHYWPTFKLLCRDFNDATHQGCLELSPRLLHPSLAEAFPNLRCLDLTGCWRLTSADLGRLRCLRLLRQLSMKLPEVGAKPLVSEIAMLTQLTCLDLSGSTCLTDDEAMVVARHGRLQRLVLTDCVLLTDFGIIMLAAGLSALRAFIFPLIETCNFGQRVSDVAVVAMSLLPDLEELDLRNHQALGPRGLEALVQGPAGRSLKTLRVANCVALCKQGLDAVSCLPALSTLEMSYEGTLPLATAPLQAEHLHVLSRLTGLRSLNLAGCNWEMCQGPTVKSHLSKLSRLSALEVLNLSCPGRRRLKENCNRLDCFPLGRLRELDISRTSIDTEGLAAVAAATQLQRLDCHECPFLTCSGLSCLSGLTALRSLVLDDCDALLPSGPESFSVLRNFANLEELSWTNRNGGAPTWIASDVELQDNYRRVPCMLAHIKHMPKLRRLHISRQSLDPLPSTLAVLSTATALEDLDLSGCFCDCPTNFNQALTALQPLTRLSRLSLDATPVDGNGLKAFCSHATGLTELNLSHTCLGDEDMRQLQSLCQLRTLYLDDQKSVAVGDEGLRHIAALPNLACLSLVGNCDITGPGLKALEAAPRLSCLDLSGSIDVDIAQALRSLQGCKQLTEVALGDPGGVTRLGLCLAPKAIHCIEVANFRASHPFLRKFALGSQVRQVSSLKSYVASLVRASLHAFLLEAVHLCMLCQKLCQKLADRLQPAEDPALPLDLWELEVAPVAGPPGPAQEKDDDEVPDCFFWSGKLVMG